MGMLGILLGWLNLSGKKNDSINKDGLLRHKDSSYSPCPYCNDNGYISSGTNDIQFCDCAKGREADEGYGKLE